MRSEKSRTIKTSALVALVVFALTLAASGQSVHRTSTPIKLRCEYLTDPRGIDVRQPRFSWVLEGLQAWE